MDVGTNSYVMENKPVKATNAQIEIRLQTVFEMVVKGCSRDFIVRYGAKEWNIKPRQIDEYLARTKDKIKELNSPEKQLELISLAVSQFNDLYQKNYTIQDFRECRNVIESRAKMLGHYAPEKHETENVITWNETKTYEADDKTD